MSPQKPLLPSLLASMLFLQDAALKDPPYCLDEQHPLPTPPHTPSQSGKGKSRTSRENKTIEGKVATMSEGQVFLS